MPEGHPAIRVDPLPLGRPGPGGPGRRPCRGLPTQSVGARRRPGSSSPAMPHMSGAGPSRAGAPASSLVRLRVDPVRSSADRVLRQVSGRPPGAGCSRLWRHGRGCGILRPVTAGGDVMSATEPRAASCSSVCRRAAAAPGPPPARPLRALGGRVRLHPAAALARRGRPARPTSWASGCRRPGTTWWYQPIVAHPDVSSRPGIHKERHFFDRFGADAVHGRRRRALPRLVPPPSPGRSPASGHRTTSRSPGCPRSCARRRPGPGCCCCPGPGRAVPVRARPPAPDGRATGVDGARRPTPCSGASTTGALDGWLEHFDPDQLLVLQYERCVADPDGQLRPPPSPSSACPDRSTRPRLDRPRAPAAPGPALDRRGERAG